ncbi:MAG TPA: copper resistance CopC family protein [Longimicrobiales bacterium]|nr:copper resistance CopC family protein [Longimicrobiales bacterium]
MKTILRATLLPAAVLLLGASAPSWAPAAEPAFHLQLDRSHPAADTTLTSPSEIRLWFSQVPQASATSLRLIRDGAPVAAVGELKADASDGKVFAAPVQGTLPDGSYTVAWRTMAADGHVVRGDFAFTVKAP